MLSQPDSEMDETRAKEINKIKTLFRKNNFDEGFKEIG